MKLGLQLQELGYDFSSDERLRIYLTNTLQEAFQIPTADGFMNRIRDEAEAAKDIKQDVPVMVILGNPPYSYESINTDPWIIGLVRDYYQVDGKPLGERNPKGLLDDYVKFIRFAQHRVSETGYGIVALITNHGYLDNPTFRGMRQNLMQTFDEIYVLDLHGNSKKKEVCPDGSPDKNVFDIQQGVAISIFIKYENSQQKLATVYHADLWGMREVYENKELVGGKYHWLAENDISSTDWKVLQPQTEFYLFSPQNTDLLPEYEREWKITEIMLVNSTGIKTHRDQLVLDFDFDSLKKRLQDFRDLSISDLDFQSSHGIYNKLDWNLNKKRKIISNDKQWKIYFKKCLYRPFDTRHYYHNQELVDRPRQDVMQHIINCDNLGLIATRQITSLTFSHILCTEYMIEMKTCSHDRGTNIFPLYLYPTDTPTLLDSTPSNAPGGRKPNLSPEFITEFSQKLDLEFIVDGKGDKKQTFGPEDIFNYIYAIFHSPNYRQRYAEFLKIDFPRVPLTVNTALFWELVVKGNKLVKYHLMKETGTEISTYPIPGSDIVEQVKYHENNQQIWINSEQYFDQVPPQVWNFYIGGYQVCQKWLKDRKGRELNFDDISHYQNIISIISETMKIMEDIDQIIEKYGGFPLE
jgi:predicted helicase